MVRSPRFGRASSFCLPPVDFCKGADTFHTHLNVVGLSVRSARAKVRSFSTPPLTPHRSHERSTLLGTTRRASGIQGLL
jgi:hypothetical protein